MSVYFYEPFYHFDRFFDELFSTRPAANGQVQQRQVEQNGVTRFIKPRMDLHEDASKNSVTATFELPGLKKEDVQIDVSNGRLVISGESKSSSEHEENGYAVRERSFGKFCRQLRLPEGVKEEEVKASLQDGVLTVTFPKSAPEAAPKKITIA